MYYNPLKVVASVQGSGNATSVPPIVSDQVPEYNNVGGDLMPGDLWYDPEEQILYIWISLGENQQPDWVPIGGDGFCPSVCDTHDNTGDINQEICLLHLDGGDASSKYIDCDELSN